MEDIKKIESWIEAIESSNLSKNEQEKRINTLVDLWKFSSSYSEGLSFTDAPDTFIQNDNGNLAHINIHCEPMYVAKEHDITISFFSEIENFFKIEQKKYAGHYKIELNKMLPNFNSDSLKAFRDEIIAAIKGEVILYKYIAKLIKFPADKIALKSQNFSIFECDESIFLANTERLENRIINPSNKWLVLMLNNLDDQCDYYLIKNNFLEGISSQFEKIFLFDFYKAAVFEVNSAKNKVDNIVRI